MSIQLVDACAPKTLPSVSLGADIRYDILMLTNLDDKDGGSVVADPWGHLGQALVVRGGGVEEPPVLPVLQQQVGVDEQDAGEENVMIFYI